RQGLDADILILSGGVSAGKRDLVPQVLAATGVAEVFHKVRLKPGKPLWFGRHDRGLVFGLPGNPVSVLVCFEIFVTTALKARQNAPLPRPHLVPARLEADLPGAKDRVIYHPARVTWTPEGPTVRQVDWFGSADLRALSAANALVEIPVGPRHHSKDSTLNVLLLR
ncbi:MAG: molybdopterin-binding protein, partial [Myxococcota bacterium]